MPVTFTFAENYHFYESLVKSYKIGEIIGHGHVYWDPKLFIYWTSSHFCVYVISKGQQMYVYMYLNNKCTKFIFNNIQRYLWMNIL